MIRIASADGLEVVRYCTNVGRSRSIGIVALGEINFSKIKIENPKNEISLFGSFAYTDADYNEAINPLLKTLIVAKQVEYAPKSIIRTGLTYQRLTENLLEQVSNLPMLTIHPKLPMV